MFRFQYALRHLSASQPVRDEIEDSLFDNYLAAYFLGVLQDFKQGRHREFFSRLSPSTHQRRICSHKSIIESLTADCSIILVDYKEATKDDVTSLSFNQIVALAICGPQVRIVTTSALIPGNNPALISADLMELVALAKEAGYNKK